MAVPLRKTFQALTATSNSSAGELRVAALDVPHPSIQTKAIWAIAQRGSLQEQMEAVRRYPQFSEEVRKQMEQSAAEFLPAIRECLLAGRQDSEAAAFELARASEAYGIIETLLELLKGDRTHLHGEAVQTLRDLVHRLQEPLHRPGEPAAEPLQNASALQHLILVAVEQSLAEVPQHPLAEANDSLIRRTAAEVLAHATSAESIAALVALRDHPNERVRDTVERALAQIASREKNSQSSPPLPTPQ